MELFALLVTGGLAGWAAGTLMRGAGYGLVVNILLGVIGGMIGGKLLALVGVAPKGWLLELAVAVLGAVLLLSLVTLVARRSS
jgi:uncharacterized membrane protein YeaQ/YmgE (transglycosylase-associated protein family)